MAGKFHSTTSNVHMRWYDILIVCSCFLFIGCKTKDTLTVHREDFQGSVITSRSERGTLTFQIPEQLLQALAIPSDTTDNDQPKKTHKKKKYFPLVIDYNVQQNDTTTYQSSLTDSVRVVNDSKESFFSKHKCYGITIFVVLVMVIVVTAAAVRVRRAQ